MSATYTGQVANTPANAASDLYVTVTDFDGGEHEHGPCRWTPHPDGTLPAKGGRAVVFEDDQGDDWVLAWTAATT